MKLKIIYLKTNKYIFILVNNMIISFNLFILIYTYIIFNVNINKMQIIKNNIYDFKIIYNKNLITTNQQ